MTNNRFSIMKKIVFLVTAPLLMALPLASSVYAADATVLVRNGDFEQVQNGKASGWSFDSAQPDVFRVGFGRAAGQGKIVEITASSSALSGYLSQQVEVKSHTNYHLAALARVNEGTALIYVHGAGETNLEELARIYVMEISNHPLAPWFWKKEWVRGSASHSEPGHGMVRTFLAESNQWKPVSIDFNSGEMKVVSISLGVYFAAGKYAFDDVSLTEIPPAKQ